jgi:uncharacterized membrane protein YhhN
MNLLLIVLAGVLLTGLLCYEKKKIPKRALLAKFFLSLLFVLTGFLQPHPIPVYFELVLAGLTLCLIGDVCLALPGEKGFRTGLGAFLLGHVFTIFGFLSLLRITLWISPVAGLIFVFSGAIFLWLRPHLKSMLVPVLFYILVISLMLTGAWAIFRKSPFPVPGTAMIFAGALCFYLSDIFVARDRFVKKEYFNRLLGLPLYYLGQFLLAFSVGLLR